MNFRIRQKVRCIKFIAPENYGDETPVEGEVYTVTARTVTDSNTYVTLKEIESYGIVFPSDCFECAEVMEDADKIVNDLIRKSPIHNACSCPDMPALDIFVGCNMLSNWSGKPLTDKVLKRRWKQSIKDEEYEKSRIYYDELIERKVLIKNK